MLTSNSFLRYILFLNFFLLMGFLSHAQEMQIELGQNTIAENEAFTISLLVKNGSLKSYSDFPEIEGFQKGGIQTSQSTNWVNGQSSSEIRVMQTYAPKAQGTFRLEPFELTINGFSLKSEGTTISVGPPKARQRQNRRSNPFSVDPFDQIFGEDPFAEEGDTEFVEIEDKAFLALKLDKDEVYVGEGFTASLAFYVAQDNRAPLNFPENLNSQLNDIVKKLKAENCWEEGFDIQRIQPKEITIRGKRYSMYELYKSRFYPLSEEDVDFPSVSLEMKKYNIARRPSFFGPRRQETTKAYMSSPKTVQVKPLPPHPLRDQVAVGDYQLREEISQQQVETGNSFSYQMTIVGQGNIAAIREPKNLSDKRLMVYEPNVTQNTRQQGNTLIGAKQFSYYAIPNEPGTYDLGNYFQWIYFNPRLAAYDTLQSRYQITAIGESKRDNAILSSDLGSFYDRMETVDNELQPIDGIKPLQLMANLFILLMLGATAWMIFKK